MLALRQQHVVLVPPVVHPLVAADLCFWSNRETHSFQDEAAPAAVVCFSGRF